MDTIHHRFQCAAAAIILLGVTVPCAAQVTPAPRSNPTCADDQQSHAGTTAPQPPNPGNENLSDKLAQTEGVLCPPNVDTEIKAPTPQGGPMPVIPPPGSPGGDPTVRPK
jgi:hypothetical protein